MTKEEAIGFFEKLLLHVDTDAVMGIETTEAIHMAIKALEQPEQLWIPCKPDTMAPAVYHRGKWYWYSSTCVDTLAEYGKNSVDEVDKDIEIVAWMPLPEPYRGEQDV